MQRFVIIGNGPAGNSAAEAIRKQDHAASVVMFSRESHGHYYTPALPELVSGEKSEEKLIIHGPRWCERLGIDLRPDCPIRDADPDGRRVVTEKGEELEFDALLLACGGNAFVPPIPGTEDPRVAQRVFTLRTMADARRLRASAGQGQRVALIGGGLLGLEAGNGLRRTGARVEVVEVFPRLLPRQTDPQAARLLLGLLESMGFAFHLGRKTEGITRSPDGLEVRLDNGTRLAADMVLISAGVRPELELARKLGLAMDRAVLVDDRMRTSLEHVYAAGDVCEHHGRYYGIWPAAVEQGRVAGTNMAGGTAEYAGTMPTNSLKVAGIALTAFGEIDAEGSHDSLVFQCQANGLYRKLVLDQGRILGGLFLGDEQGARAALAAMRRDGAVSAEIRALFQAENRDIRTSLPVDDGRPTDQSN